MDFQDDWVSFEVLLTLFKSCCLQKEFLFFSIFLFLVFHIPGYNVPQKSLATIWKQDYKPNLNNILNTSTLCVIIHFVIYFLLASTDTFQDASCRERYWSQPPYCIDPRSILINLFVCSDNKLCLERSTGLSKGISVERA